MVENLTKTEIEVKNVESEIKISDEELERQLKLQIPKLMLNPSDSCIQNILKYSKSMENTEA